MLILGEDSTDLRWSPTDIVLAKAYQRFLNELCQQCGGPKYLCHNDSGDIQYKLVEDECAANQKVEKARYDHDNKKGSKPKFGVRLRADPYLSPHALAEGKEFSDYRRPYLLEEMKKAELIAQAEAETAAAVSETMLELPVP